MHGNGTRGFYSCESDEEAGRRYNSVASAGGIIVAVIAFVES